MADDEPAPPRAAGASRLTGRRSFLGALAAALPAITAAGPPPGLAAPSINRLACRCLRRGRDGVVGNGKSNPLSASFRTLAAARAVFPHAGSLDDELEWAVAQQLVNEIRSAGGGVLEAGEGEFVTTGRPILFPVGSEGASGAVSLLGAGSEATRFRWLADGGEGSYILACADRATESSSGFWRGFGAVGPGRNVGFGNMPCNLSGLGWGARRKVEDVWVQDLRYGVSIQGDHTVFRDLRGRSCFYGVYFDQPNTKLFGNLTFIGLELNACWKACVGVHPDAAVAGTTVLGGSSALDASPFGFYKEMGGRNLHVLEACTLIGVQMENIGNAGISGGSAGPVRGAARPTVRNTRMIECQISWAEPGVFAIPHEPRSALLDIGVGDQLVIEGFAAQFLWRPGDDATFLVLDPKSLTLEGDVEALISHAVQARRPLLGPQGPTMDHNVRIAQSGVWRGRVLRSDAAPAPAARDVVSGTVSVQRSAGSPDEVALGVCVMPPADVGGAVVVATEGRTRVNCSRSLPDGAAVRAGPFARAAADGQGRVLGTVYRAGTAEPFAADLMMDRS